jgi:hypothetical protein
MKDLYLLPVTSRPNQRFQARLIVDGKNLDVILRLSYREVCGYWTLSAESLSEERLISNLPLLCSSAVVPDLLAQYSYLGLGALSLAPVGAEAGDMPGAAELGGNFLMVWGSNG